jgi:hypothetical protein
MRVYHFINSEYGLKDLRERRLKISRIMELNDPFEFLGADLSNREFRKAMKATKKALSKTRGILCFSANWINPVQWTHYADRHRGICLGFDIPDDHLSKVDYVPERLSANGKITEDLMLKFLTTKFIHWAYEEEYRLFLALEQEENGLFYVDFSEDIKLSQLIIGAHSSVTRAEVKEALGEDMAGVEVFKARAAFRRFEIVRNRNEKLWS